MILQINLNFLLSLTYHYSSKTLNGHNLGHTSTLTSDQITEVITVIIILQEQLLRL